MKTLDTLLFLVNQFYAFLDWEKGDEDRERAVQKYRIKISSTTMIWSWCNYDDFEWIEKEAKRVYKKKHEISNDKKKI